jgi:hypothetical protein
MIGLSVSARQPRTEAGEFVILPPESDRNLWEMAGIEITIKNNRKTPVFVKWRF